MSQKNCNTFCFILIFLFLFSCQNTSKQAEKKYADYVDPFIGTMKSHLSEKFSDLPGSNFTNANVTPGAKVPWGLTCITPRNTFTKGTVGYYYGEEFMYGFAQLHLSGVGCSDWGNFIVTPSSGKAEPELEDRKTKYTNEKASPGYYSVLLLRDSIKTEVTATQRATFCKFSFKKDLDTATVIIDLYRRLGVSNDAYCKIIDNKKIEGYGQVGNFCGSKGRQKLFFVAEFDKQAFLNGVYKEGKLYDDKDTVTGAKAGAYFYFKVNKDENIRLKLGLSFVSIKNAWENMKQELSEWDFELAKQQAEEAWEKQLAKIKIEGGTKDQRTIFYTALYRALLHPSVFNDVNGEYLAMGHQGIKVLSDNRKNQYTVFSLWDTYRNLHPLLSLVYPKVQSEVVKTMIDQYEESGFLPKWELGAKETYVMAGDPGSIVIADTYMKNIRDYDVDKAFEAIYTMATKKDSNHIREGIKQYIEYGYIPDDLKGKYTPDDTINHKPLYGSVATSLEYYLADFGVAQMAKELGKDSICNQMYNRSLGYKKLYNSENAFLQPRNKNGSWYAYFAPQAFIGEVPNAKWPCGGRGLVEGNAWHYLFFVPHDIKGLSRLMGKDAFVNKLQQAFDGNRTFELYNEPDMAYPYLFTYIEGEEWRSQKEARKALNEHFKSNTGGWPGNDDCGTLSAWYIFSAMGFYPACPGTDEYRIGSPVFDKIVIELDTAYYAGNQFIIETHNNSPENIYIKSLKLNGKQIKPQKLLHQQITNGGKLMFEMSSKITPTCTQILN